MATYKRRIFNLRPLFLIFILLILAILVGESIYARHIAIVITLCLSVFAAFVTLAAIKKTRRFCYIPLAVLIGLVSITSSNAVYDLKSFERFNGEFVGIVASEVSDSNGYFTFYMSDVTADGKRIDGKVRVTLLSGDVSFDAGDLIKVKGEVEFIAHKRFDSVFASRRANGIIAEGTLSRAELLADLKPKFPLSVKDKIYKSLNKNANDYTAQLCKALLFGDRAGFDSSDYDNISKSGLAHVLAVSGLHITTLSTLVYFILKKMKVKPKYAFITVTALTFIYSMLCSFTASSLRALIMTAVLQFASAFGKKHDPLSSLSLAGALILTFRPTAIMEMGFLLSFYAILGILFFNKPLLKAGMAVVNKISPKRQFGKKFAEVVAVSLSTSLLTMPLVALTFERVPTLFVLSNFFVLPYVMIMYIVILCMAILTLIFGAGGWFKVLNYLFVPFRGYVEGIGGLSFSSLGVTANAVFVTLATVILFIASGYVLLKRREKWVTVLTASGASVILWFGFSLLI